VGGFFGVVSKGDCVPALFFGTDYHSHLGTKRGGLAVLGTDCFQRAIKDISNTPFRSKFEDDVGRMKGASGIGVISDTDDQPLIIGSHLGNYALVTVGVIQNLSALVKKAFTDRAVHFSEMSGAEINPTEVVATLINQGGTFEEGIRIAQDAIDGSCSLLLLTDTGIYAGRDKFGRTPVIIGKGENGFAATMESCAFPNLGFEVEKELGPGEIVLVTAEGVQQKAPPGDIMQMCAFFWIYYGYPASSYEGFNVEASRYRCGGALAEHDDANVDFVSGIPDSGTAHAIGYAQKSGITYRRPFVKYTPTWPRSFMPQVQSVRELVAKMKLIPIRELIEGTRLLFCDDSVVRGTQLKDTLQRVYNYGAKEIHLRPACPPLVHGCKFLNFSRSSSEMDLAARKAIGELEGKREVDLAQYSCESSDKYHAMVERIRLRMELTSLKYQKLDDMVKAIKVPEEKLCTYCWNGCDRRNGCRSAS
jgi:amidophosphoribosyltransferase